MNTDTLSRASEMLALFLQGKSYQRYSAAERRKTTAIKKAAAASQSLVGAI